MMRALDQQVDLTGVMPDMTALPAELEGLEPLLRQWLLKLLCDCGVALNEQSDKPWLLTGISSLLPAPAPGSEPREVFHHYRSLYPRVFASQDPLAGPLHRNLELLASSMGLTEAERDVIAFGLALHLFDPLDSCVFAAFPKSDPMRLPSQLSRILGHPARAIERAMSTSGPLAMAGLMCIETNGWSDKINGLIQINRRAIFSLTIPDFSPADLLGVAARSDVPATLSLSDFDHMRPQTELLLKAFHEVGSRRDAPLKVLFNGEPGLGKTELARLLAAELGARLYEVRELDPEHRMALVSERISYFRLIQHLVANQDDALIMFDEADAVLIGENEEGRNSSRQAKPMLIRLLEDTKVPAIWIVNDGYRIDPAILRRFDLTIHFKDWTPNNRRNLLSSILPSSVMGEQWVRTLERTNQASPARIAQASHLARLVAENDERPEVFRRIMEENLQCALGTNEPEARSFDLRYRLSAINANEDLNDLARNLAKTPRARLCLYGPPGTGKTRYAEYLAARCNLELTEYRASDLLDAFVGQSEKNIREMFATCSGGERLLFLDEADSLFRDRRGARQGWEVSQVNELLKGLERFQGLFVASTNLLGNMDPAVMRRMDFKLRFGWLKPEQAWRLFLDLARKVGLSTRGKKGAMAKKMIEQLNQLTPGDFALVARRLTISNNLGSPVDLARLLEAEVDLKPEARTNRPVGFTARL